MKLYLRCGEIFFKRSEVGSTKYLLETLEKIINVVTKDSAVARISRTVTFITQAYKCRIKDSESIKYYINRFNMPSLAYLNMS